MKDRTFWKRQYEKFIKQRLCSRRDCYLEMARCIDDQIESLLDMEENALAKDPGRVVLFLHINDEFNKMDPIGVYPAGLTYEYDIYAWELVELYERSDEITFYWQLPMYIEDFWYRMFCNFPSQRQINSLERGIRTVVSQFYEMRKAREKSHISKEGQT